MARHAVIFLAPGFEELEALSPVDVFRRAGLNVTLAAVQSSPEPSLLVSGAHGVRVQCECRVEEVSAAECQLVYLPGGMPGATNLAASETVRKFVRAVLAAGGLVCAICAAPVALDAAGVLAGVDYTCYPGFEKHISNGSYTGKFIQKSGNILTACGPGAALDFSLEILRSIGMGALAGSLAEGMQLRR